MTVSRASLMRNTMHHVSAGARVDREGFMPPPWDWTRSPETTTTSSPPTASESLPLLSDADDSLAMSLPKKFLRTEEDMKPIMEEKSTEMESV